MSNKLYSVITTIQSPTAAVRQLLVPLNELGAALIIIGDKKGPSEYDISGTNFLDLDNQLKLPFNLARELPVGHYARKNVGYLVAIAQGAESIYETDDDNAPLTHWGSRKRDCDARVVTGKGWVNAYQYFTQERIWPRGYPLDEIVASLDQTRQSLGETNSVASPIQQGLANGSPDVDAVWRLVMDAPFEFDDAVSVCLPTGAWCPFNSQSTWWWPDAYPLLYLPSYCSFRMTDIWRSFIAQRCLWEMGFGVVFHPPEVFQERNEHDLMRDFSDEIPGYLRNKELVNVLEGLNLEKNPDAVGINLLRCYEALVKAEFFPENELILVRSWLEALGSIKN